MPIQVLMPALSPTMTEGTLAKWMKGEGDPVAAGNVLAEIETDKATMEVEAVDEGTLGRILVPDGTEGVAVNTPIALLLEEGEDAAGLEGAAVLTVAPPAPPPQAVAPAPQATAPPSTSVHHSRQISSGLPVWPGKPALPHTTQVGQAILPPDWWSARSASRSHVAPAR